MVIGLDLDDDAAGAADHERRADQFGRDAVNGAVEEGTAEAGAHLGSVVVPREGGDPVTPGLSVSWARGNWLPGSRPRPLAVAQGELAGSFRRFLRRALGHPLGGQAAAALCPAGNTLEHLPHRAALTPPRRDLAIPFNDIEARPGDGASRCTVSGFTAGKGPSASTGRPNLAAVNGGGGRRGLWKQKPI